MPVVRFVREGRDVECYPGENLREVALREGIQLYGLKGQLGNCGGCGQCVTCFVAVVDDSGDDALSARTTVEISKLRRRPQQWRLACQALVERSLMVLTRPQTRLPDSESRLEAARQAPLPSGPLSWPMSAQELSDAEDSDPALAATADDEA
jgi:ferredoxin